MPIDQQRLAEELRAFAVLLDSELDRTFADLALLTEPGGSGGGGPSQKGSHSDPTGFAVVAAERNPWVDRERRFRLALLDLRRVHVQLTRRGAPNFGSYARNLAAVLDARIVTVRTRERIMRIVCEVEGTIRDVAPIDREQAKAELAAVQAVAEDNEDARQPCIACDSPPSGKHRRGLCVNCDSFRRKRNKNLDSKLTPRELRALTIAGIVDGTLRRPRSPHLELHDLDQRALIAGQELRVDMLGADWFEVDRTELQAQRALATEGAACI